VHRWYGLAHSFSPELVRFALRRFGLGPGAAVADPFCGAGTTLVEARRMAMSALGVDLPPVAVLASRVKCSAQDPGELRRAAAALRGRRGAPAEPADPEAAFEAPVAEAALKGLGLAEGGSSAPRRKGRSWWREPMPGAFPSGTRASTRWSPLPATQTATTTRAPMRWS
jgi:hypothetical protein